MMVKELNERELTSKENAICQSSWQWSRGNTISLIQTSLWASQSKAGQDSVIVRLLIRRRNASGAGRSGKVADQQQTSRCDSYHSFSSNSYSTIMAKLIMAQCKSMGIVKRQVVFRTMDRDTKHFPRSCAQALFRTMDRASKPLFRTIDRDTYFVLRTEGRDAGRHHSAPWTETTFYFENQG